MELIDPPHAGSESETLVAFLDYQRGVLRRKVDSLDADQLGRRLAPSTMTLGGLLKHLAYVEDWWVNQVYADNAPPEPWASVDWKADGDWEWHSAADDIPERLRELYDETVATSDHIVREALARPNALETLSRRTFRQDPSQHRSLRWILVHLIEEYARHLGHADLIRESIDGSVGD